MNIPVAIFLLVLVSLLGTFVTGIYKLRTQIEERRNRELRLEQEILDRVFAVEQRIENLESLLVARVDRAGR